MKISPVKLILNKALKYSSSKVIDPLNALLNVYVSYTAPLKQVGHWFPISPKILIHQSHSEWVTVLLLLIDIVRPNGH